MSGMGRCRSILLLSTVFAIATSCVSDSLHVAAPVVNVASVEAASPITSPVTDLLARLTTTAPAIDPQVLDLALQARALAHGDIASGERLAVINYSLPSTQPRLWVFDVERAQLMPVTG